MRINILPKSTLGKLSVGLAAVFILVFVLAVVLTGLGGVGPGPLGPIIGVVFGVSGIAALVTGIISTIKNKERSILVFLAIVMGLTVLVFLLGEFLYPH